MEQDDSGAASGALSLSGTLVATEATDFPTIAGTITNSASATLTEADETIVLVAVLELVGTLVAADGDDVPSANGKLDTVGSASIAEANDTLDCLGAVTIEGASVVTEADDTFAATALMPIWYPRRGGDEEWAKYERRQIEWEEQLRRIIDRSWRIANGEIDPITFEPIPPPDYSAIVGELLDQALTLDQARTKAFIAEQERLREEEAISILLLAA